MEVILAYHVVFSVAVPILITDLLFPDHRLRPYLQMRGLVITAVCFVLGVGLLRITVVPTVDPGYTAPIGYLLGAAVIVIGLGIVALSILPRMERPVIRSDTSTVSPSPWMVGIVAGVSMFLALRLPMPFQPMADPGPTFGPGLPVYVLMGASLAAMAILLVLLRRWSTRSGWSEQHLVGLAGGLLLAHTAAGAWFFGLGLNNGIEFVALAAFAVIEAVLVFLLSRRIRIRSGVGFGPLAIRT